MFRSFTSAEQRHEAEACHAQVQLLVLELVAGLGRVQALVQARVPPVQLALLMMLATTQRKLIRQLPQLPRAVQQHHKHGFRVGIGVETQNAIEFTVVYW